MKAVPVWIQLSFGLTLIALIAAGTRFYSTQKKQTEQEVGTTLRITNELKAKQITAWRADQLAETIQIMESPFVSEWLAGWLMNPKPEKRKQILELFQALIKYGHYYDVLLVTIEGQIRLNVRESSGQLPSESQSVLQQSIARKKPMLTQLFTGTPDLPERLDAVAPLIIGQASQETVAGALVLVNDAREYLFPVLQFWPMSSGSAECQLVTPMGDHARIFSHRSQGEQAVTVKDVPTTSHQAISVKAALGVEGILYGKDYRGTEVVAAVQHIPDSPWSLVSKIDISEAFSHWRSKSILIIGWMAGFFVLLLMLGILLWLYYRSVHYKGLLKAERAYRDSEARYQTLFESNPQPMWVYDRETLRFLAVNDSAVHRYGYSKEEFLSMSLADICPTEDLPRLMEKVRMASSGLDESGFWTHRKKNGDLMFVEISTYTLDWKDRPAKMVLVHDVTDRLKSENELRESEERFRAVVETAPEAIMIQTGGCFAYLNPAAVSLFGAENKEQLLGKAVIEQFFPEDRELVWERMHRLNDDHQAVPLAEEKILQCDGTPVDVEALAVPFHFHGEHGALVFLRNISERKRNEQERERMSGAIEQAAEEIIICDANGIIQYVNPAFESITGYSREEAIGQNPRFLKSGSQDEAFYRDMWRTISSGGTWEGRFINRKKDGTLFTEEVSISPIRDRNGAIVNYVAVKRDISHQLHLEEEKAQLQIQLVQAQKMEAVGRLAGGVAHDFNNMLQAILGYTDLALESVHKDDFIRNDLIEVKKAAQRSVELTRQLLAFARKQPNNPKTLDINSIISGLLKMLVRLIGEDIDLVFNPGQDVWTVRMDPTQVDQILANLVVNARDAIAGTGKITIETRNVVFDDDYCSTHVDFIPGEYVQLAVSDSGRGMDKETLQHVFEPFFTTKASGEGTGLGLATVYGIVKQNDGLIHVYTEVGEGTSFRIYFPRFSETQGREILRSKPDELVGGAETIFIVEDEELILDLGVRMLNQLGYQVITAKSPEEAVLLFGSLEKKPDLLLTDVIMPEMNGPELARRLMEIRPELKCLYMSGYTADVIAHRKILEKDVHFIQKPFSIETLAAEVRAALDEIVS
ncbi:MAG: hypothetical protein AMXMBFR75_23080 [Candidatus Hinthialibacteria bacterium]